MTDKERLMNLILDLEYNTNGTLCDGCGGRPVSEAAQEIAVHLLANGVTFHKWVPTALGFFPDEYGRYLCVVRSFAFPGCFYQTILQYDNYGFREGNIYTDDVAYWMPLLDFPKEEKNNG